MVFTETDNLKSFILQSIGDSKEGNSGPLKGKDHSTLKMLNKRQTEVLVGMAKGMTVYAISKELGISEDTIRFHKKNIFDKLDANCTVQAVVQAIRYNYINLSDI